MSDDPWGDRQLREFLRPAGREPFTQLEETMDTLTEDIIENTQETDPNPVFENYSGEGETDETEKKVWGRISFRDSPDSYAGRIFTLFETFPKEKFPSKALAETTDMTWEQAGRAVSTLRRNGIPIFHDNEGYWYDPNGVREAPKSPRRTTKPKTRKSSGTAPIFTRDVLETYPVQESAVILYEIYRDAADYAGRIYTPTEVLLDGQHKGRFPSRPLIIIINKYLRDIGAVHIAGPIKTIRQHPNEIDSSIRERVATTINDQYKVGSPKRVLKSSLPVEEKAATVLGDAYQAATITVTGMIEQVDENRLAGAIAEGMWNRYEWAMTEIGRLNEQLVGIQEGVRVRDEEIARLRGQIAQHENRTIREIAQDILTTNNNGG